MKSQIVNGGKRAAELARVILVSPEILVGMAALVLFLLVPTIFRVAGERFKAEQELWKYLALVPLGLLAWGVPAGISLLFPMKDSNRIIVQWPDFWRLKMRVYVALIWIVLCAINALVTWAASSVWSPAVVGFLYLVSISLAFVSSATIWIAQVNVRQILEAVEPEKLAGETAKHKAQK